MLASGSWNSARERKQSRTLWGAAFMTDGKTLSEKTSSDGQCPPQFSNSWWDDVKITALGAWALAQWLRSFAVLPEDLNSDPRTNAKQHTTTHNPSSRWSNTLFSPPQATPPNTPICSPTHPLTSPCKHACMYTQKIIWSWHIRVKGQILALLHGRKNYLMFLSLKIKLSPNDVHLLDCHKNRLTKIMTIRHLPPAWNTGGP